MKNILIGIDPEMFLFDHNLKQYISAIDRIGGTKELPKSIGRGCAVQEDNMSVEFNTPATNSDVMFKESINFVKDYLNSLYPNVEAKAVATVIFNEDQLQDERAWVFGCDPDFDAYTVMENSKPKAKNKNKRTAGGHIHFGYSDHAFDKNLEVIKLADLLLGIPSLFMDGDKERREMYGKAGAHRNKAYGVEYRTLSNFWIAEDALIDWAFAQSMRVFDSVGKIKLTPVEEAMCRHCINTNNTDLAMHLVKKYQLTIL